MKRASEYHLSSESGSHVCVCPRPCVSTIDGPGSQPTETEDHAQCAVRESTPKKLGIMLPDALLSSVRVVLFFAPWSAIFDLMEPILVRKEPNGIFFRLTPCQDTSVG